jgi:hypothetical protein
MAAPAFIAASPLLADAAGAQTPVFAGLHGRVPALAGTAPWLNPALPPDVRADLVEQQLTQRQTGERTRFGRLRRGRSATGHSRLTGVRCRYRRSTRTSVRSRRAVRWAKHPMVDRLCAERGRRGRSCGTRATPVVDRFDTAVRRFRPVGVSLALADAVRSEFWSWRRGDDRRCTPGLLGSTKGAEVGMGTAHKASERPMAA